MEHIGKIEKRLWSSADNLRANSNFASNEYFLPVMGLIFLRHAYSRFLMVRGEVELTLPKRGGKVRPLTKEDFSQRGAIFLHPEAQFDHLVSLPDSADRAQILIDAMEGIEKDYEILRGALPKSEYQKLDNDILGQLLRTFNDPALKQANGDIFGRIYEYFLTKFADQKAHDDGEFFTPVSLVQMIVNVIEPAFGRVLDPACGSGGMFVQSAYFIEHKEGNATERATFYGMEKNPTTIWLANMNLAVHGLEGNIKKAITYYDDPHELHGKCDFVMANPPFNVDEIDAEKVKTDPRLPFGLPSVKKGGKVSNGNYLWISYFDSYLNAKGRAGFVMSSQASSAVGEEAKVRRKLIEAGHVDVMMAIRSGFFYTRTVPCELWFLDKAKPEERRNKILMIDARNVYRKVTQRIHDFTPEQQKNLSAIVWLHRGQADRFVALVAEHLERMISALGYAVVTLHQLSAALSESAAIHSDDELAGDLTYSVEEFKTVSTAFEDDSVQFETMASEISNSWRALNRDNVSLKAFVARAKPMVDLGLDLSRHADQLYRLLSRLEGATRRNGRRSLLRAFNEARKEAVERLKMPRYFHRQARWLQEHFPEAVLRDVEGLVKLVDFIELEENDWSLTPGRYVGVATEEEEEEFDFEETIREFHVELKGLNEKATFLAAKIDRNFEELVV